MRKNRKKKSSFSAIIAWIHLWPSIVAGIIVVFTALSGTLIVYADEIISLSAGDARYVSPQNKKLPLEQIFKIHKAHFPELGPSYVVFYKDPARSLCINTFDPKGKKLSMVYMNPYTGEILKYDKTIHFFFVLAHLHKNMLMNTTGAWIVTLATIIFVISTITGLILWWPKRWNKKTRQASFTIRWKAKFKRLNYDLHNVSGFYSLVVCFILGMTGLILFFSPLMNLTIRTFGGTTEEWHEKLPAADSTRLALDVYPSLEKVFQRYPGKNLVKYWVYDYDRSGVFSLAVADYSGLKSEDNREMIYFNKYTGQEIKPTQEERLHDKVENIVWQLHMGQWFGQLGKLSTFIAGLIATSLPITGFLIWWGRRKSSR
jgi:uncharacterized iron-regulated membrane protein